MSRISRRDWVRCSLSFFSVGRWNDDQNEQLFRLVFSVLEKEDLPFETDFFEKIKERGDEKNSPITITRTAAALKRQFIRLKTKWKTDKAGLSELERRFLRALKSGNAEGKEIATRMKNMKL